MPRESMRLYDVQPTLDEVSQNIREAGRIIERNPVNTGSLVDLWDMEMQAYRRAFGRAAAIYGDVPQASDTIAKLEMAGLAKMEKIK